ncbi:MAG: HipA family kinase [Dehalococcoidia bacterium]|jgi:hypothetical protein
MRDEWRNLIREADGDATAAIHATTFLECIGSFSAPVKILADDGRTYLIKGRQIGKAVVNDRVVGLLGKALGAPVASVTLVDLPQPLIAAEPAMRHMMPGMCHGSLWLENCTDREGITYTDVPENRTRFAALAILYTWVGAQDHQFIYQKAAPHIVYSVDHGHFFPGGPDWRIETLRQAVEPVLDPCFHACDLGPEDLAPYCDCLRSLPNRAIAEAVAAPCRDWQITEDERIELAFYLDQRRIPTATAALRR